SELLPLLARGEVSAEALTASYLDAIRRRDPKVRAFLHVDEASALEQARRVDDKRRAGQPLGALAGLPVAVKDVLCTRGQPTTCPPACAASSASSRPTGASRASASSPSPARWTRSAPSPMT